MSEDSRISEIRGRVRGPVNSIYTTFTRDGEFDWNGIRQLIDNGIENGSDITLLTFGDSQLGFMTDQEVAELTRVMVEQSAGRSLTVAATKRWATRTTIEFAEFCKGLGVDLLMTLPMDHVFSDEGKINWYKAAAEVLPIMIVGFPTMGVLEGVKDEPRICSFKEDGTLNYTIDALVHYPNQWAYITGGMFKRHLTQWPYGVESYFCWAAGFAPDISRRYWTAIQGNDLSSAAEIVRTIEAPLFKLMDRYPEMFQDVIRGALELNGVAQRYLPSPRRSLTDSETEELSAALKPLGLLR